MGNYVGVSGKSDRAETASSRGWKPPKLFTQTVRSTPRAPPASPRQAGTTADPRRTSPGLPGAHERLATDHAPRGRPWGRSHEATHGTCTHRSGAFERLRAGSARLGAPVNHLGEARQSQPAWILDGTCPALQCTRLSSNQWRHPLATIPAATTARSDRTPEERGLPTRRVPPEARRCLSPGRLDRPRQMIAHDGCTVLLLDHPRAGSRPSPSGSSYSTSLREALAATSRNAQGFSSRGYLLARISDLSASPSGRANGNGKSGAE